MNTTNNNPLRSTILSLLLPIISLILLLAAGVAIVEGNSTAAGNENLQQLPPDNRVLRQKVHNHTMVVPLQLREGSKVVFLSEIFI